MTPATNTDASSKSTNSHGPANAPSAPANFQSPAPRLRSSTKGKSNAKPSPAPSREVFSPLQPLRAEFTTSPVSSAGTVSQFGIRRARRSVQPPITARSIAPAKIAGFKQASRHAGQRLAHRGLAASRTALPVPAKIEKDPLGDSSEIARGEG